MRWRRASLQIRVDGWRRQSMRPGRHERQTDLEHVMAFDADPDEDGALRAAARVKALGTRVRMGLAGAKAEGTQPADGGAGRDAMECGGTG